MIDRIQMCVPADYFSLPSNRPWGLVAVFFLAGPLLLGCGVVGGGDEDTTPPDAPTNLSATAESETVTLEWSAPSDEDLAGYNVYRASSTAIDADSDAPLNGETLVSAPSFTDESPENGTTYRYRITAVDDSDNESSPSDSVRMTPFADPPSRPSD